jgi:hypothetical protein
MCRCCSADSPAPEFVTARCVAVLSHQLPLDGAVERALIVIPPLAIPAPHTNPHPVYIQHLNNSSGSTPAGPYALLHLAMLSRNTPSDIDAAVASLQAALSCIAPGVTPAVPAEGHAVPSCDGHGGDVGTDAVVAKPSEADGDSDVVHGVAPSERGSDVVDAVDKGPDVPVVMWSSFYVQVKANEVAVAV